MRRLLEVGEVLQAGDCVWTGDSWREVHQDSFGVGEPLHAGDAPFYRNEPDGRADLLDALQALHGYSLGKSGYRNALTPAEDELYVKVHTAISKAKGETP